MNDTLIDNIEDLYIVMPMYNLSEYSDKYSVPSGIFWNYFDDANENNADNYRINNMCSNDYECLLCPIRSNYYCLEWISFNFLLLY